MSGGIGIQVAIRCRPFAIDDRLGVKMRQVSEEEGEVELINCEYTTTRFPFTYAWWSAYGYDVSMRNYISICFFQMIVPLHY
jgi:hypothetical protein